MGDYCMSKMSDEVDMDVEHTMVEDIIMQYGLDINKDDDCIAVFTNKVFPTRDELLKWVRAIAFKMGFVIVILRSDTSNGIPGRKTFVLLGCERGGKYRPKKKDVVGTVTGTRKCHCPFRLRGTPIKNGEGWTLKLLCGSHNHDLAETLVGHPYAGRLTSNEKTMLVDMMKSMVKPRNILLTLKEHNENNVTTIKQVYNARSAYQNAERGLRTQMQHLMNLLEGDMYIHWHRIHETSEVMRDIFWTHPDAVKLVNAFNIDFMMDSTYKTNRYRLPLLEIVGVTPTGLTFSAAFVYLEAERQDNFVWALERLRGLFWRLDGLPKVFVTDRDIALMNAVKIVFPESTNILCHFHIDKNVKAKCKTYVAPKEAWDQVMDAWGSVMDCPTESEYEDRVAKFEVVCSPWIFFVEYVKNTWLLPHKERFVKVWTDKVMHLGNTTSNRVESAHWSLKRLLQTSMGDLCNCWDAMNNLIILQHTEIKASFENSINVVGHSFNVTLYKRLRGFVSRYALNHIADEFYRVGFVGVDNARCGCILRTTHGLPCACELARYVVGSIPLSAVHIFWTRLSFNDMGANEEYAELFVQQVDVILKRFKEVDIGGKLTIKTKLREIAYPEMTSMCPPTQKVNTKGSQKGRAAKLERSTKRDPSYFEHVDTLHSVHDSSSSLKYSKRSSQQTTRQRKPSLIDQFDVIMHPYILDIIDVKADGHCGYRAVAGLLGMGEDSWPLVRNDLHKELGQWRDEYATIFGGYERFERLKRSLLVDDLSMASVDKWMTIPNMGYVIASRYNVILVFLSQKQSISFFPLRTQPPNNNSVHRMICLGHVNGNHFVQVFLQDRCPIPNADVLWSTYCHPIAKAWVAPYIGRMQQFTQLLGVTRHYINIAED